MYDNPYMMFLALLQDQRAENLNHLWVLDNFANHQELIDKYKNFSNVSFVEYNSDEYRAALCSAHYLINNGTFPTYFTKKEGQIYINTWHGIALKHLGYDMPNGKTESSNTVRNFLQTDYLISTNTTVTDLMYANAYKMKNIFPGKVIEEGYPRLDLLFYFTREEIFAKLHQYGVNVDPSKKIILYAPTWRGMTTSDAISDITDYIIFHDQLAQYIDTNEYQILIKPHHVVYQNYKDKLNGSFFIPATLDANEILSVTDLLITDFSSIFVDYLATDKPILFYIPDLEAYQKERGLYKTIDQLPGPATKSINELATWINDIDNISMKWRIAYKRERNYYGMHSDGQITARIIDAIFFGGKGYKIRTLSNSDKKKILITIGDLRVNGVGSSFLNLLCNIDYNDFDVTTMFGKSPDQEGQKRIELIPSEVRVIYRNSTFNMTWWEYFRYRLGLEFGFKNYDSPVYKREYQRSYGEAQFDYILDFDGYNRFYSVLALQDPRAKTFIWLHSDMQSEYESRNPRLKVTFKLYPHFDYLISCTKEVGKVNMDNLSIKYHIPKDKFRCANNCMDLLRFNEAMEKEYLALFHTGTYISLEENKIDQKITTRLVPYYPKWDEKDRRRYRFVTVGRMSPEKNQLALIRAFDRLHSKYPRTMLYVLGDGPLREEINKLVNSLPSRRHIMMPGNIENPFKVMRYCDCFILPSLYEGQGLAVMEARALHMPIIVTNFDAVGSISLDNGQLIIKPTENDIYKGMEAFIQGKVPSNYIFDVAEYNAEAYQEFLAAIGEKC